MALSARGSLPALRLEGRRAEGLCKWGAPGHRGAGLAWWLSWYRTYCDAGDPGSIPGLGRSAEEGSGYPLQYSSLEDSMDRAAWQGYSLWGCKRVGHDWRLTPSLFCYMPAAVCAELRFLGKFLVY